MMKPLKLLLVEDSEDDAQLVLLELQRLGYETEIERVETAESMQLALQQKTWDLILSDYSMPAFSAPQALEVLNARGLDLPFIIISGTIGEETAVAALKAGAHDFLVKGKFARLGPAIERELREAETRRERKRAEELRAAGERRFRALIENAPDGITVVDAKGTVVYVSPSVERILGYSQAEALGQTAIEYVHPEDGSRLLRALARLTRKPGQALSQHRFRHKDGSWRWLESTMSNLIAEPNVGAIIFNYRDVTERMQAEEQIQRQLKRLNALRVIDIALISSFDLRVVLDVVLQQTLPQLGADASAILLVNPHLRNMEYIASRGFRSNAIQHVQLKSSAGYASRVVTERGIVHVRDLIGIGGELTEAPHLADEGFVDYYGIPLIVKGEVKGVLEIYHRAPLNLDSEQLDFLETLSGQAAIAIDNSQLFQNLQRANAKLELRVAERTAELNRTNLDLEHANRAKDEFLATMSHELRTPLNSILGLSEALLDQRRGSLNEHQQASLQIIETSGQHLLALINDILQVSKIEAGKMDIHPDTISVKEVCESSLNFIRESANKKSISVEFQSEPSISTLLADPQRLKQILVNLLSNAVKFTSENGKITLEVHTNSERDQIHFSVADNGIGIAPDDMKKLFTPFTQLDSSMSRQYEGTGLGLVLVYKFTELHGGSVQVESEVGIGSRFTVILPWSQNAATRQHTGEKTSAIVEVAKEATPISGERVVILLADDHESNVLVLNDYLQDYGYEVVLAHNGLEALEKAEKISPGIILMDIQMPEMDGLEAMRRLRQNPRFASTPIIALTALAMPGDRELCLEAGANEYMSKPVSLKMLLKTIGRLLNRENK